MNKRIYLDYAASAPVLPAALEAFTAAIDIFGNPSSPHEEGRQAKELLEDARSKIAHLAGVKPRNIVFTSGATEANALAIRGALLREESRGTPQEKIHVLYLPTAHASVVQTVQGLANATTTVDALPLKNGVIDLEKLAILIRPETVLVVVDAICGETGTRFDLRGVRKVLDDARAKHGYSRRVRMHVDASQLPTVELIDRLRLSADTLTLDAQKVGGVRGIGVLVVGDLASLRSIRLGGGQEEGLRPGTEPVSLAVAFGAALETVQGEREAFVQRSLQMREKLLRTIEESLPDAVIYRAPKFTPHIVNCSFPGIDTDYAVMLLDAKGFAVSTKSACETDSKGSRAVALLTGSEELAKSTLRISWGVATTEDDLERFTHALIETIQFLRAQSTF
jgi:cysteine desulfurase